MSAAVSLSILRARGIRIQPSDEFQRLSLEAPQRLLTNELVESIREHKPALLEELRAESSTTSPEAKAITRLVESWPESVRDRYQERAAIIEFEGGLSRSDSERLAFEHYGRPLDRAALIVIKAFDGQVAG